MLNFHYVWHRRCCFRTPALRVCHFNRRRKKPHSRLWTLTSTLLA